MIFKKITKFILSSYSSQHFPYFKTAPNGWKNSVRHNLSLNKCFEKIEKPSTNGSQRKGTFIIKRKVVIPDDEILFSYDKILAFFLLLGCLWAMNPSKVVKMDEEVQKWSRKDPQAIKKAMVYPGNVL